MTIENLGNDQWNQRYGTLKCFSWYFCGYFSWRFMGVVGDAMQAWQ
jgi:hypothetical protein